MNRLIYRIATFTLLSLLPACDALERARGLVGRDTADAAAGGVTLHLEAPGMVRMGELAMIRLNIQNRGDTAVSAIYAEVFLPSWMEPLPPDREGAAVTMVGSGEGTTLSYAFADPPLQPGESRSVVQRFRTPPEEAWDADVPTSSTVRASLLGADRQPLGVEIASDVAVAGSGEAADTAAAGSDAGLAPEVSREGVGDVRLGMTRAELRDRYPGARDTSWTAEGMSERGLVIPLQTAPGAGNQARIAALLEGDRVSRLYVRDPAPRTGEGVGVGSRLEDLRSAYGPACADIGEEGAPVVWFPAKPGLSFVLDAPGITDAAAIRRDPAQIPGTATVRELFVRRGADGC
jgi:hypothetical protein